MHQLPEPEYEVIHRPAQAGVAPFPHSVLFVHGAWHGAWCWQAHFMPYFAERGFDVTAFSLRGHGKSSGRRSLQKTRLRHFLHDLLAMIERYETPPILVGHSMGGLLIQHVLCYRQDVPAAVLLAPIPPTGTGGLAWRTATKRPRIAYQIMTRWNVYPLVAEPDHRGRPFFSARMPAHVAEQYMRRFTHESFLAVGVDALLLDLPGKTPTQTPVLVIGGEDDTLFTPMEVRRTARWYGTDAIIMPEMGHELMLDPGWDNTADQIVSWLRRLQNPYNKR